MSSRQLWQIEVRHEGLKKYRLVRGTDRNAVQQIAASQKAIWEDMWNKRLEAERRRTARELAAISRQEKKDLAGDLTADAQKALAELNNLLKNSLAQRDRFEWDDLMITSGFDVPRPEERIPRKPTAISVDWCKPNASDPKYLPGFSLLDKVLPSRKERRIAEARSFFERDYAQWKLQSEHAGNKDRENQSKFEAELKRCKEEFDTELAEWEKTRQAWYDRQQLHNGAIAARKERYFAKSTEGVVDYCHMILTGLKSPQCFPVEFEMDYNAETRSLVLDFLLPAPDDLPKVKEVKFVQSRNEISEVFISESELRRLYDSVLYQTALALSHRLYAADLIEALHSIVFNGWVRFIDRSTGNEENACIMSLQTDRAEFLLINLANVDPRACFVSMKGVASSKLHGLVPVPPIVSIDRDDKRFIASYEVGDTLNETTNLAAMDWEDFEHLIRELFEKELAQSGGEVKVTQASRDGGVDAVAFDPDPIRGGKIVIQAKRYTNVVGVSAVRDLYGTVLNEGATKGILVTTATYGPDAYEFAKGKPLTLLSGGNLLHLLEKHGQKAKIDLKEAKRILIEREGNRS